MLFKSFFLLISVGQAARVLRASSPRLASSSDSTLQSTKVLGTITSLSILEGNGCPGGTYHPQPFEPGKSINAFVDFDTGSFVFNSTSSPGPVSCTLSIDFEFVYPGDGAAEIMVNTMTSIEAKYEEGDVDRGTNFIVSHDLVATAGDEEIDGGINWIMVIDGPGDAVVGAALLPEGTPGAVDVGTLQTEISIYTDFGPGELAVSRVAIGFGLEDLA